MEVTEKISDSLRRVRDVNKLATNVSRTAAEDTDVAHRVLHADIAHEVAVTRSVSLDSEHLRKSRVLRPDESAVNTAAYKMLRTQVLARMDQIGANTLAVVGASAHEGKTLTAINLAISLASDLNRTALLVDLDLRNPNVHRRFGIEPEFGIDDCLQSRVAIERALVRPEGYERLTLLPARNTVGQSSELLASNRAGELVHELKSRYANRIVIFDLPPILEADDALAFSKHIQAALLVVCEGRTRRDDLPRAINLLRDTLIVGTVLNGSRERSKQYY